MEKVSSKMVFLAILLLAVSGLLPEASGLPCRNSCDCRKVCNYVEIPICLRGNCKCYASEALKDRKGFSVGIDEYTNEEREERRSPKNFQVTPPPYRQLSLVFLFTRSEVSIPMESEGTSQSEPTSRRKKQDRRLWIFAEKEALLVAMMESEDAAEVDEVVETPQDEANIELDDMLNECYTPTFANGDTVFPRETPFVDISTSSETPTSNAIPAAARTNANTPRSNANAPTSNVVPGRPKKKANVDSNEASIHVAVENLLAQCNTAFNKIADAVGYEDRLSSKREKVFTELMKLDLEMIDRFIGCFDGSWAVYGLVCGLFLCRFMGCFVAVIWPILFSFGGSCFVAVLMVGIAFGNYEGLNGNLVACSPVLLFTLWCGCYCLLHGGILFLGCLTICFFGNDAMFTSNGLVGIAFANYDGLNGNLVANGSAILIMFELSEPNWLLLLLFPPLAILLSAQFYCCCFLPLLFYLLAVLLTAIIATQFCSSLCALPATLWSVSCTIVMPCFGLLSI
ncbi:hypothetical protein RHSIM_RhsimUnG0049100 [Rhododendron simsii]|uniref:Uncharacterized protein n=1 Tax=Rhododendron simsii TaxID=118357 RepID=A0A834FYY6_RHOSS|nr:hypothetical protein RHSIM_RhsimUnG0049100 [Rhododendron simsii]